MRSEGNMDYKTVYRGANNRLARLHRKSSPAQVCDAIIWMGALGVPHRLLSISRVTGWTDHEVFAAAQALRGWLDRGS